MEAGHQSQIILAVSAREDNALGKVVAVRIEESKQFQVHFRGVIETADKYWE